MEKLLQRLKIMIDANILKKENMGKIIEMIEYIKKEYDIQLTEENSSMLVTHIVMYLGRKSDSKIEPLDDESLKDIKNSKKYEKAIEILDNLEKNIFGHIYKNEKGYILLHLINVLEGV